jgi:hypothetical protein
LILTAEVLMLVVLMLMLFLLLPGKTGGMTFCVSSKKSQPCFQCWRSIDAVALLLRCSDAPQQELSVRSEPAVGLAQE